MSRVRLIQDGEDDDYLIAIVLLNESEIHPVSGASLEVYPVMYVGYGDDVMVMCSMAWIDDQPTVDEFEYNGETDYKSLYENIMLKM